MLIPKYLAILKARMIDGLYRPFSSDPMVCRDTSSAAARSSWRISFSFLISSNRFFNTSSLLNGKFALHKKYIISKNQCQVHFPLIEKSSCKIKLIPNHLYCFHYSQRTSGISSFFTRNTTVDIIVAPLPFREKSK